MGDRHHHHHHHQHKQHHHQQQHKPTHIKISGNSGKVVVCYLGSWATYRPSPATFNVEDIDVTLCTHVVYAFAGLDAQTNTIISLDNWQDLDTGKCGYNRAVALKQKNPQLKVTIAIGGWNESSSSKYSDMAASRATRAQFIKSVLDFLKLHKFDGLDLDWEYPTTSVGQRDNKANFVALVKELNAALKPHKYILTAALGAGKSTMDTAYDFSELNRYLDLIHVMCYDYHSAEDGRVGANAPMVGTNHGDVMNLNYTINYMLRRGVSADKLVLGVPAYGKTFVLQDPSTATVKFGHTPTKNKGFPGPLTAQAGFMGYNEICLELQNNPSKWTQLWDHQSETPYLRNGEQVVSYDNPKSIARKVQFALSYGLKGVMMWSIETDDFKGMYRKTRHTNYPLLRTINYELKH